MSVSDSIATGDGDIVEGTRESGGGDMGGASDVLVVGVREVTSETATSELRWPASTCGDGSLPLTEDAGDGNEALEESVSVP